MPYLPKQNVSNSNPHTTLLPHSRFGQYKSFIFDPATSCNNCRDEDEVTIINVALLALIDTTKSFGILGNMALGVLNGMMNAGGRYAEKLYLTAKVKVSMSGLLAM